MSFSILQRNYEETIARIALEKEIEKAYGTDEPEYSMDLIKEAILLYKREIN